jgi:hypothetical protein
MKKFSPEKRQEPFGFVLEELRELRPTVRRMFGFTYVYLGDRLLLSIRESARQPRFNGVWLYTEARHIESLRREFSDLPRRCFWKSGENGWVILASGLEGFEECALRACELVVAGDRRIGRATRGGREKAEGGRRKAVSSKQKAGKGRRPHV